MGRITKLAILMIAGAVMAFPQQPKYNRGVGVYPGNPDEDFAPPMVEDSKTYRNLALLRPAYQSSSYDYNLTAQLVTDGIKDTKMPRWLATTLSTSGLVNKIEREFLVDNNVNSNVPLNGPEGWMQFEMAGGESPFEIDKIGLQARIRSKSAPSFYMSPDEKQPQKTSPGDMTMIVEGSDDGKAWKELGRLTQPIAPPPQPTVFGPSGSLVEAAVNLSAPARSRFYRVTLKSTFDGLWFVSEIEFFNKNQRVQPGGPYHFTSAWMPESKGEEWVYVDLGSRSTFDRIVLQWIKLAAEGVIQVSDDAVNWKDVVPLSGGTDAIDDLKLKKAAIGRYVRALLKRPAAPEGYILSEFEVYGKGGGPVARPENKPPLKPRRGGGLDLGNSPWRLQRDSLVSGNGADFSKTGYQDSAWIPATVPATVLSSYLNIGALPDPNYGENQLMISDSFFYADFWYRTEFTPQFTLGTRRVWLNFDGVNWKAEVYLNGNKLGRIEGAFTRAAFDITDKINFKGKNALAICIEKNATPGSMKQKTLETAGLNGGALGADNPTYHASIGWDWIPTVRGRNIGIWNDVYLTATGAVTVEKPFIQTTLPLPNTSRADVRIEVEIKNHESRTVNGILQAHFGSIRIEKPMSLDAGESKIVVMDPDTYSALRIKNPRLWWPNGYGDQNMYDVDIGFIVGGFPSDLKSVRAGIRQFTYSEEGGTLQLWINGRRFIARGGNWGFPETNLRYRNREYNIAVAYHRDMNFTMIRNWVGQTGDEEFYEACDRNGIVVWQDFWLANPVDGPDPADNELFLSNVKDYVMRIRNHPSIGLYVGRNEGVPPKPIDDGIRKLIPELHPGLHYISNSAWDVVSGGGPYQAYPAKYYFQNGANAKLHSERGMPNIVTYDSLKLMMPESALWPQSLDWGLHDFNLTSAQRLSSFRTMIDKSYGGANNAEEWVTLAQFINYEGYRAIFEAQSKNRMGVLLWMSHPSWPSFVWQTYDYYFDPNAGYFGSKKGSEPLHIQWNSKEDTIEVVNYNAGNVSGLTAEAEILNMDGAVKWQHSVKIDSNEDSVQSPITIEYPSGLTPVHFIRLKLRRGETVVSENFYWRGVEENNYQALRTLPKVKLDAATKVERIANRWLLTTVLRNAAKDPAIMVHLKAVRQKSGDRILPVSYSDNYVSLMPGESRTITTTLDHADTRGESPTIVVEGFNVAK